MDVEQLTTPTEKTKAPGRVAWGKKLAEMKRQQKSTAVDTKTPSEPSVSTQTLISIGCLALGAGALYYQYRTYHSQPEDKPKPKDDKPISKSRLTDMR